MQVACTGCDVLHIHGTVQDQLENEPVVQVLEDRVQAQLVVHDQGIKLQLHVQSERLWVVGIEGDEGEATIITHDALLPKEQPAEQLEGQPSEAQSYGHLLTLRVRGNTEGLAVHNFGPQCILAQIAAVRQDGGDALVTVQLRARPSIDHSVVVCDRNNSNRRHLFEAATLLVQLHLSNAVLQVSEPISALVLAKQRFHTTWEGVYISCVPPMRQ
jgi:hypothetical protein